MNIEDLKLAFTYNPDTGDIFQSGRLAGYIMGTGYRLLCLNKKRLYAHRVAWALVTGEWPSLEIDHINQNKSDNRWSNLRLATRQQNARHQKPTRKNTSGFKGVSFHKRTQTWRADIFIDGKQVSLGHFNKPEAASDAYKQAALQNFGAFASI